MPTADQYIVLIFQRPDTFASIRARAFVRGEEDFAAEIQKMPQG